MGNIAFDISSALYVDKAKAWQPDENGVYKDMPVMVLGKVSRNNKNYDVESMLTALTNPNSVFCKKLLAGQLQGEYGHPLVTKEEDLPRIAIVDPTKVSHAIHSVRAGKTTEQGWTIVYADIEPFGPYGPFLDASFKNPRVNTAFSLRSLVSQTGTTGNVINQRVTALITIDAVDAPGYAEASKVQTGTEGITVKIEHPEEHMDALALACGCESTHDQQLLDMLQVDRVVIEHRLTGIVDRNGRYIRDANGKHSIFHEIF